MYCSFRSIYINDFSVNVKRIGLLQYFFTAPYFTRVFSAEKMPACVFRYMHNARHVLSDLYLLSFRPRNTLSPMGLVFLYISLYSVTSKSRRYEEQKQGCFQILESLNWMPNITARWGVEIERESRPRKKTDVAKMKRLSRGKFIFCWTSESFLWFTFRHELSIIYLTHQKTSE